MTSEKYKELSLKEFDDNDPSVYNMCRKDYPNVSGLKLERYEVRRGFRLHCVVRKSG
ncbi:hypothetical protein [uncultured Treponema sp.]|uniref:hypothetical protein n=1 Tax=uncultured Treponema sp. TaxID=162155 RepID=UPI002593989E|nr:hypothetical protein [uncultured Treponema sp.]